MAKITAKLKGYGPLEDKDKDKELDKERLPGSTFSYTFPMLIGDGSIKAGDSRKERK